MKDLNSSDITVQQKAMEKADCHIAALDDPCRTKVNKTTINTNQPLQPPCVKACTQSHSQNTTMSLSVSVCFTPISLLTSAPLSVSLFHCLRLSDKHQQLLVALSFSCLVKGQGHILSVDKDSVFSLLFSLFYRIPRMKVQVSNYEKKYVWLSFEMKGNII